MEFSSKAVTALRENIYDQHTEMKKELQERHKEMTNHLGEDVSQTTSSDDVNLLRLTSSSSPNYQSFLRPVILLGRPSRMLIIFLEK